MYFSKSQNYLSQNKIHIGDKGDWRIATLETQVGVSVAVSPVTRPCAPRPCHGTSFSLTGAMWDKLISTLLQVRPEWTWVCQQFAQYSSLCRCHRARRLGKAREEPWLCVPCKAKPGPRSSVVRAALSPCPGRSRWLSQPYCHPPLICHPVHWYF
jgi:hypothetical protein